jgi:methylmalonyl-CoA/ethylmalonyl-CoA epimerase
MSTPALFPLRLDHLAIAVPRITDALPFLVSELGGRPAFGHSSGVFRFGQWRFANGAHIEILEPRGPDGFVHRFLDERGPGVHHVTFKVPDLRAACDRAEALGYAIVGYNDADPRWLEAFLHPKQALGIVVQLAQAEGEEADGGGQGFRALPHPADPPPPVSVLGLRMRAVSRDRARRQWEEILMAESEVGPAGDLIFRWPGSPMYLAVDIDPTGLEGPVRIELASERSLALPRGAHANLGVEFTLV